MVTATQMEETLNLAISLNLKVCLTLWLDDIPQEINAYLHYINYINNHIHIKDEEDQVHYIQFDDIINIAVEKPFS